MRSAVCLAAVLSTLSALCTFAGFKRHVHLKPVLLLQSIDTGPYSIMLTQSKTCASFT